MALHVIKNGLDIPIKGEAAAKIVDLPLPETVAWTPEELKGIVPRLAAKEGDRVEAGGALFYDKRQPDIRFLSPVAGVVKEIRRGRRRVITDVIVEVGEGGTASFKQWDLGALASIGRDEAREGLAHGGLWGVLRTRPLDAIPAYDDVPQAILVAATESGPCMPGADVLLDAADAEALQAGIYVLKALTSGTVHLTVAQGSSHPALANVKGVEQHHFSGPHPSGDPALQINHVCPPEGSNRVWYARAWDVALIGKLFLSGRYPAERIYAAVGTGVKSPRVVRTVFGAPLTHIAGEIADGPHRWVRGSVLTGKAIESDRWASSTLRAVHVLPDRADRELFGWTMPNLGKFSAHRAFLSGFTGGGAPVEMDTNMHGGHRALIPIGYYGRVVSTPDIMPDFLFRSIIAGDLEEAIKLGLLDITPEEAALCTYVCPSKLDLDIVLRDGLAAYEKEA